MLNLCSFHLISSHRSFSSKLLTACHCHRSLCHPISSQLISCLLSSFTSSHLILSDVFSPLLSYSQLITTVLISSHVTRAFLISSHLISYLRFSQLFSALCSSCKLILCVLISSLLFSHLLSSSHIYSADLSSCQLVSSQLFSAHSQIISPFLWPKTRSKNGSRRQSRQPLRFQRGRFEHREAFTQSKLLHREACTRRSFYRELGKLLFTASLYTKQALAHSKLLPRKSFTQTQKLLHREAFTQRSFYTQQTLTQRSSYTEKLWQTESFCTQKLLHKKYLYTAFTHRSLYTAFTHSEPSRREAPTQKSSYTEKPLRQKAFTHRSFYTKKPLHSFYAQRAFTQLLHTASLHAEKFLHTEGFYTAELLYTQQAFTQRIFYTQKLLHTANFHTQPAFTQKSFCTQKAFTQRNPKQTFPSNKWCSFQTNGSWASLKGVLPFFLKKWRYFQT